MAEKETAVKTAEKKTVKETLNLYQKINEVKKLLKLFKKTQKQKALALTNTYLEHKYCQQ